jgi:hypothetical protein
VEPQTTHHLCSIGKLQIMEPPLFSQRDTHRELDMISPREMQVGTETKLYLMYPHWTPYQNHDDGTCRFSENVGTMARYLDSRGLLS